MTPTLIIPPGARMPRIPRRSMRGPGAGAMGALTLPSLSSISPQELLYGGGAALAFGLFSEGGLRKLLVLGGGAALLYAIYEGALAGALPAPAAQAPAAASPTNPRTALPPSGAGNFPFTAWWNAHVVRPAAVAAHFENISAAEAAASHINPVTGMPTGAGSMPAGPIMNVFGDGPGSDTSAYIDSMSVGGSGPIWAQGEKI